MGAEWLRFKNCRISSSVLSATAALLISSTYTPRVLAAEVAGFTSQVGPRLAIEQTHTLQLQPSAGEPDFISGDAVCVITGAGDGFAIGMPTHQSINSSDPEAGPPLRKNLMAGLLCSFC